MAHRLLIYRLITAFIASVWLLSGLCAKVLHLVPRHEQIVARVLGNEHASTFTLLIGIAEICLAVWILSGVKPRLCALLQMILVAAMNIIEIVFAPDLLLFGQWNAVPAFLFIALVYFNEFLLRKRLSLQPHQWAHS
jgi:uncharacterized membrane protein YphA (DoxX/SURF4 family)